MSKQIKQYLIALLTLGLIFLANSIIWAWTAPTANPPSSNVAAPINVSATAQTKSGNLNIGSGLNYWITKVGDSFALKNNSGQTKFIVGQDGHVGIGIENPLAELEVAGRIRLRDTTIDPSDPVKTVVTKEYLGQVISRPNCYTWISPRFSPSGYQPYHYANHSNYQIVDLTDYYRYYNSGPSGSYQNICSDLDGCTVQIMQFTDMNQIQWGLHETSMIYQFSGVLLDEIVNTGDINRWVSSIASGADQQGKNGNGIREFIGGYDYCDIIDDEPNYGENDPHKIIFLDGDPNSRCFFRICD